MINNACAISCKTASIETGTAIFLDSHISRYKTDDRKEIVGKEIFFARLFRVKLRDKSRYHVKAASFHATTISKGIIVE